MRGPGCAAEAAKLCPEACEHCQLPQEAKVDLNRAHRRGWDNNVSLGTAMEAAEEAQRKGREVKHRAQSYASTQVCEGNRAALSIPVEFPTQLSMKIHERFDAVAICRILGPPIDPPSHCARSVRRPSGHGSSATISRY